MGIPWVVMVFLVWVLLNVLLILFHERHLVTLGSTVSFRPVNKIPAGDRAPPLLISTIAQFSREYVRKCYARK